MNQWWKLLLKSNKLLGYLVPFTASQAVRPHCREMMHLFYSVCITFDKIILTNRWDLFYVPFNINL